MVACFQCRQRKVRCHGGPPICNACTRLSFPCSLQPQDSQDMSSGTPVVPRKRGARACDACRAQKSRCSGNTPCCSRCQQLNLTCHYTLPIHQYRTVKQNRRRTASIGTPMTHVSDGGNSYSSSGLGDSIASSSAMSSSHRLDSILGCDRSVVRRHIDAFFDHIYPVPLFGFLHRVEFMSLYSTGDMSPTLLLAVCGISSRFVSDSNPGAEPKTWIERAETTLFQTLGKTTVADIQAIAILILNRAYNNHTGKVFLYLALAVRMAVGVKLHKEDTTLSFVDRESRRRLLWCIYALDRLNAGGVNEFTLLSANSIDVHLPCPEHNFQVDLPIVTPKLRDGVKAGDTLSISALHMRMLDTRSRILQYTKHLLDTKSSPETSLEQFQAFEKELKVFQDSLPAELSFSVRAFQLRAFSPERTTFIMYHLYYHHCHCELYRLLNPGYREALPQDIINATAQTLITHVQSQCLEHAVAIGEMIASTHDFVDTGPYASDVSCFVVLYQASCAILYACHRDSPAYNMESEQARRYFVAFIKTLTGLLRYFPRYAIFVNDIRKMLYSIDDPHAPLPVQKASAEVDFRARPVSSEESSDDGLARNHVPSAGNTETGPLATTSLAADMYGTISDNLGNNSGERTLRAEEQQLFATSWPSYFEDPQYDPNFSESMLWDWTALLGTNPAL